MLSARGHEVCALTRNQDAADWLRDMGAEVCVADALDAELMRGGVAGTEPDVILHQLSALPRRFDPDRVDERFADNDRIRIEGTRNLIGAARAARVRRLIAQSIAFGYAPDGERVKREDAPLFLDAPGYFGKTVAAVAELERQVLGADGIDGLVLRYGYLHGDGTAYADDGQTADSVRAGELPIVEGGEGLWSFTHVEDAAAAAVAAVEGGAPGAYNVVDDDPVAARDWLPLYA